MTATEIGQRASVVTATLSIIDTDCAVFRRRANWCRNDSQWKSEPPTQWCYGCQRSASVDAALAALNQLVVALTKVSP